MNEAQPLELRNPVVYDAPEALPALNLSAGAAVRSLDRPGCGYSAIWLATDQEVKL
jgi:hypothetical protein